MSRERIGGVITGDHLRPKCKKNHKFEGWFKDSTAFEEQKKQNLITCPVCGESGAEVVPSSLAIMVEI